MTPTTKPCSPHDMVSLKEYIETRLNHVEDLRRASDESSRAALTLASGELSRRLDILNGEAGRLHSMQMTYLPREVHDSGKNELITLIESNRTARELAIKQIRAEIEDLKLSRAMLAGKASQNSVVVALLFSFIGAGVGIVSLLLAIIKLIMV